RCNRWRRWWQQRPQVPWARALWLRWTYSLARAADDFRCRPTGDFNESPQPIVIRQNGTAVQAREEPLGGDRSVYYRNWLNTQDEPYARYFHTFLELFHEARLFPCPPLVPSYARSDRPCRRRNVAFQRLSQAKSKSKIWIRDDPAMVGSRSAG